MDKVPYDFFEARDGLPIRYGIWPQSGENRKRTLILLPGRREFLEKYMDTIGALQQRGFQVFGMDWRGQGLSGRLLENRHKGHVGDYAEYLEDLDDFIRQKVLPGDPSPITLLAHSMGAHISLRYLHDHGDIVEQAVLTSPMVDILPPRLLTRKMIRKMIKLAVGFGLAQTYVVGSGNYDPSGQVFEKNKLTSDLQRYHAEQQLIAENSDLALGGVTYGWLNATFQSIEMLSADGYAAGINTPILILSAEKERIVSNSAQQQLSDKIPSCTFQTIPGSRHEILNESDSIQALFWREFDRFVNKNLPQTHTDTHRQIKTG
jgi:lysophospholipase